MEKKRNLKTSKSSTVGAAAAGKRRGPMGGHGPGGPRYEEQRASPRIWEAR